MREGGSDIINYAWLKCLVREQEKKSRELCVTYLCECVGVCVFQRGIVGLVIICDCIRKKCNEYN